MGQHIRKKEKTHTQWYTQLVHTISTHTVYMYILSFSTTRIVM